MPPKKKLKPFDPQPSSSNCEPDIGNCELYFDRLPTEIVVKIVNFLTPVDIYHFAQVCSPRCAEAAYDLKTVSYDACRRVEFEHVLALFNSVNLTNITEINFNNVCHISGSNLTSVIVRCKQLITLSIINCSIILNNAITIFQQCKKLENFSWDVQCPTNILAQIGTARELCAPSMKNVFLLLNKVLGLQNMIDIKCSLHIMFSLFPSDVNIYLNYSSVPIFHPVRFCHSFQLNSPLLTKPVSCFSDLYLSSNIGQNHKYILRAVMITLKDNLQQFLLTNSHQEFFTEGLSYLQFTYVEAAVLRLKDFPVCDIESLAVLLDYKHPSLNPMVVKESSLKYLKWPKLKNLTVQEGINFGSDPEVADNVKFAAFAVSPLISLVMLNAPNITTLNFSGIHVGFDLPIKDISSLKCLVAISIPTCGMQSELSSEEVTEEGFAFLEVITTCTEVKHFSLTKCVLCSGGPNEEQLMHLKTWKKMMDLSISNVPTLRVCTFLRAVADSCPDLRALHLSNLGNERVCHYIPNVTYVLRTSKRLQLLRLYQGAFHLDNALFWRDIKSASNLEGLCIVSHSSSFPPTQRMLSAFRELKFLYILHLRVKNISQVFERRVKQIFHEHQVKTRQISMGDPHGHPLQCNLYHFGHPNFHDIVE